MMTHPYAAAVDREIKETADRLIRQAFATAAKLVRQKIFLLEAEAADQSRRWREMQEGDSAQIDMAMGGPTAARVMRELADAFDELAAGEK